MHSRSGTETWRPLSLRILRTVSNLTPSVGRAQRRGPIVRSVSGPRRTFKAHRE